MDANNEVRTTLARMLKEARERSGMKQSELARQLGVSGATISRWERGQSVMKLVEAPRVARAVGINPHTLTELAEAAIIESVTSASVRTGSEPVIAALEGVLNEALEDLADHELRLSGLEGRVEVLESQHSA